MCWHRNVHVSFKQTFGCENYQLFSNQEHGPLQGPDIGILKWHQGLSKLHCWWSFTRKEFQKVCEEIPNIVQISDCKKSSRCKMECAMSWHECQTFECLTCGSLSYGDKVNLDCLTSSFFFFLNGSTESPGWEEVLLKTHFSATNSFISVAHQMS